MTLQTVMLALMIGVALMLTAGIAYAIAKWLDKDELTAEPDPDVWPPEDRQSAMYLAWERYCNALDEAALNMDTKEYDRIRAIGWRRFGVDAA